MVGTVKSIYETAQLFTLEKDAHQQKQAFLDERMGWDMQAFGKYQELDESLLKSGDVLTNSVWMDWILMIAFGTGGRTGHTTYHSDEHTNELRGGGY